MTLVLCAAPTFAEPRTKAEAEWAALSESEKVARLVSDPELVKEFAPKFCDARMSMKECLDVIREAVRFNLRVTEQIRTEQAEAERKATMPHNDPGAVSLCPPPRRMTRDGCQ